MISSTKFVRHFVRTSWKIRLEPSKNSSGTLQKIGPEPSNKIVWNLQKIRPEPSKKSSGTLQKIGPEPSKNSSGTFKKFVRSPPKIRPNPKFHHTLAAKDPKQQGLKDLSVSGATIFLLHLLIQYVPLLLFFVILEKMKNWVAMARTKDRRFKVPMARG